MKTEANIRSEYSRLLQDAIKAEIAAKVQIVDLDFKVHRLTRLLGQACDLLEEMDGTLCQEFGSGPSADKDEIARLRREGGLT